MNGERDTDLITLQDDIRELLRQVTRLIDSCADHDIFTDALVTPANPERYHAALAGIRECSCRIRKSGATRDQIASFLSSLELPDPIFNPRDLIPLIFTEFTPEEEALISSVCQEWGRAIDPEKPGITAEKIRSALFPLSLADLLDPSVTRMQRFPAIMALEQYGSIPLPGTTPPFEAADRILIVLTDDPGLLSGQLHPAIFRFLVRQGLLPDPVFPNLLHQALGDIGIVREAGPAALDQIFAEEILPGGSFFRAGASMFRESGLQSDVRKLFRATLQIAGGPVVCDDLERLSGHLLAGVITASPQNDDLFFILEFLKAASKRPHDPAEPKSPDYRDLHLAMQEHAQLIRAITRDYTWRSIPYPDHPAGFRPVVDLWPDRHLILYDSGALLQRTPDTTRALLMEALYCHWFPPPGAGIDLPENPWYSRIARILSVPRAVERGSAVHPGVSRWFDRLRGEENDPATRCANRFRINRLPLPDQFLEGVLSEARTGSPAVHIKDEGIRNALANTADARKGLESASDEEWHQIMMDRVWPMFEAICLKEYGARVPGVGQPAGTGRGKELAFSPRGTMLRRDAAIQSPVQPSAPFTGRVVTGGDDNLAEDGGIALPAGSNGAALQGGDNGRTDRQQVPGSGGSRAPVPSGVTRGSGAISSGVSTAAGSLMDACTQSREILDAVSSASSGPGAGKQDPWEDNIPALTALSEKIDAMASDFSQQIQRIREAWSQRDGKAGVFDPTMEELDGLLKVSERVRELARDYRDATGDLAHKVRERTAGKGQVGQVAAMTREILEELQAAGAELQRMANASSIFRKDTVLPGLHLPGESNEPASAIGTRSGGRLDPAFAADSAYSPEIWESFSYFDATFDENTGSEPRGDYSGCSPRDTTVQTPGQSAELALTREAEEYLAALKHRTRSDWETMDEKAERIRRIALFESHAVGGNDYAAYQRFYQPVAGLIIVTRKNIQQALQKSRANRDVNELISGDDIDEENLAAVRTTMRIFRDRGREPDKTRWCLSLLIDASSSMHDETVAKKLQAAIQAAILFGEAVNHLKGIQFEIAAFSDTEYIPLKRYQDDWNVHQGCYLIREVVRANGGTNDVGAVSSALDRMNRLPMAAGANRLIFVISDGQSGVGGREQMRAIVKTQKNTRIFGWGIGPDMERIEETYRPYGTWVPDIAELPRSIGEVLRRELGRPAMAGWRESRGGNARTGSTGQQGEKACPN